ncbi:hypothetical protein D0B54_12750 [Solimonas sp. K1W22B-7]|uniref:hypothetical protein n=1 Tax=Solimonas sp. K1W22B-7 TaxID=2303331 RepID=UPI000E3340CB|nr:hypothetical protein [Solimonas sp. K1W22B-7]AXQ29507.1 hypothetical protein D0B54_12750 [Solimonas sp. K1W22B-7]
MTVAPTPSLHHLRTPRRAAVLWLLLAVLFARGLVAPGFMPQFGAGGVGIVLCTPQGPKTLWKTDETPAGQHAVGEQCAFGLALGMAGLAAAAPLLDLALAPLRVVVRPQAAVTPRRERGTSARGPPSYS